MPAPHLPDDEQRAFFDAVYRKALQAQAAKPTCTRILEMAGVRIRLVFAGDRLEKEFMPAVGHLVSDLPGRTDVTLNIWDSESTGVAMVPPPCDKTHYTERGDIWGFGGERYRAAFHWIECSLSLFDRREMIGIWWVQSGQALPVWTKASPMRSLFQWSMELFGKQLLHGAAIGNADGALLIVGRGGVGKSTTALSALLEGLNYLGDDYVIVGLDPEPAVHSIYSTAKLSRDQIKRLPQLEPLAANDRSLGEQKAVIRLYPNFSAQLVRSMPLRAVLTPRFGTGRGALFEPVSSAVLWRAASFVTMSQLPYAGTYTTDFVDRMIQCAPSLEIILGTSLKDNAVSIRNLLGQSDTRIAAMAEKTPAIAAGPNLPLVSVVVPVCNGTRLLEDAINAIASQDYPSTEIIVVVDGSTDCTDRIIHSLPMEIRCIKHDKKGVVAARNRGISEASGELIAFLDLNDLWPENNLHFLVDSLLAKPEASVVIGYGRLMEYGSSSRTYDRVGKRWETHPYHAWGTFPYYIGAGLYRRSVFDRVGLFDPDMKLAEDADWFQRALEANVGLVRVPLVTLFVHQHSRNIDGETRPTERNTLRVLKKRLDRTRQSDGA